VAPAGLAEFRFRSRQLGLPWPLPSRSRLAWDGVAAAKGAPADLIPPGRQQLEQTLLARCPRGGAAPGPVVAPGRRGGAWRLRPCSPAARMPPARGEGHFRKQASPWASPSFLAPCPSSCLNPFPEGLPEDSTCSGHVQPSWAAIENESPARPAGPPAQGQNLVHDGPRGWRASRDDCFRLIHRCCSPC